MRLLCADDEEDIRTILSLALSLDPELQVEIVGSGAELLALARVGRYDAFVLDGMMPGMDGYETCRRIREEFGSSVVVVALTGWGQERDKHRALQAGFDLHLTKPADPTLLEGLLATAGRR